MYTICLPGRRQQASPTDVGEPSYFGPARVTRAQPLSAHPAVGLVDGAGSPALVGSTWC